MPRSSQELQLLLSWDLPWAAFAKNIKEDAGMFKIGFATYEPEVNTESTEDVPITLPETNIESTEDIPTVFPKTDTESKNNVSVISSETDTEEKSHNSDIESENDVSVTLPEESTEPKNSEISMEQQPLEIEKSLLKKQAAAVSAIGFVAAGAAVAKSGIFAKLIAMISKWLHP